MTKWERLAGEFVNAKQARLERETVEWYQTRLAIFVEHIAARQKKPKRVTVDDLNVFFGHLKTQNYKYNTRKGFQIVTKSFFKWLRKRRVIKHNPFDEFEPLPRERDVIEPLPLEWVYRMIRAAEADPSPYGIRDAAIMRLLLTTGARREEVVWLPLAELRLDEQQVFFTGKFGHRRMVPLKSTTSTAVRRWLGCRPATTSSYVFVSLHPNKKGLYTDLRPDALNDVVIKWRDEAGLPKVSVSPHKWRHRFASEMKKARDPFALQMLLGHADISTTQRYAHSSPEELVALLVKYGPDMPD